MKTKSILSLILTFAATLSMPAQTPAPLVDPPPAPSVATQQAAATARIKANVSNIAAVVKYSLASIQREIGKNRDGLTPAQVVAGLPPGYAASLAAAQTDLVGLVNKYAPGTLPAATAKPKAPAVAPPK